MFLRTCCLLIAVAALAAADDSTPTTSSSAAVVTDATSTAAPATCTVRDCTKCKRGKPTKCKVCNEGYKKKGNVSARPRPCTLTRFTPACDGSAWSLPRVAPPDLTPSLPPCACLRFHPQGKCKLVCTIDNCKKCKMTSEGLTCKRCNKGFENSGASCDAEVSFHLCPGPAVRLAGASQGGETCN